MTRFVSRFGRWALDRANEKSTWAGLTLLAATSSHSVPAPVIDALSFWGPWLASGLIFASTTPQGDKQ